DCAVATSAAAPVRKPRRPTEVFLFFAMSRNCLPSEGRKSIESYDPHSPLWQCCGTGHIKRISVEVNNSSRAHRRRSCGRNRFGQQGDVVGSAKSCLGRRCERKAGKTR